MPDQKIKYVIVADTRKGIKNLKDFSASHGKVTKAMHRVGAAGSKLKGRLGKLRRGLFSLKTAVIGLAGTYGLMRLGKSFLSAADTMEQYRVTLTKVMGSMEEGNKLFEAMSEYAATAPFTYEEIMKSATALAGIVEGGTEEIKKWMPVIGDIAGYAKAMGITFEQTASQVMRMFSAGASAAEMFKERGISSMLGFEFGVHYTVEETKKMLWEAYTDVNSKFRGMAEAQAKTWGGVVSMLSDKWMKFRTMVMDSGPFRMLKSMAMELDDYLNEKFGSEWMETLTGEIGDKLIEGFKDVIRVGAGVADLVIYPIFEGIKKLVGIYAGNAALQQMGVLGTVLFGLKGAAVVTTLGVVVNYFKEQANSLDELNKRLETNKKILEDYRKELEEIEKKGPSVGGKIATWLGGGEEDTGERLREIIKRKEEDIARIEEKLKTAMGEAGEETGKEFDKGIFDGIVEALTGISGEGFGAREAIDKLINNLEERGSDLAKQAGKNVGENLAEGVAEGVREAVGGLAGVVPPEVGMLPAGLGERQPGFRGEIPEETGMPSSGLVSADGFPMDTKAMREQELNDAISFYEEKNNMILDATRMTEQQKNEIIKYHAKEREQIEYASTGKIIGMWGDQLGQFASLFREISMSNMGVSKEAFAAYKAFSVAEATIAAYTGYTKALDANLPPGALEAYAAMVLGLGMAKVALIASQEPPSFDTGGVSTTPGYYYSGIPEAHIPLQGGKVPVVMEGGAGGGSTFVFEVSGNTFVGEQDFETAMVNVAEKVARKVAPSAVAENYANDGIMRTVVKSGK